MMGFESHVNRTLELRKPRYSWRWSAGELIAASPRTARSIAKILNATGEFGWVRARGNIVVIAGYNDAHGGKRRKSTGSAGLITAAEALIKAAEAFKAAMR